LAPTTALLATLDHVWRYFETLPLCISDRCEVPSGQVSSGQATLHA